MRTYVRSEILLTQGEIALTRSEILLAQCEIRQRRVNAGACEAVGTGSRPRVCFMPELVWRTQKAPRPGSWQYAVRRID